MRRPLSARPTARHLVPVLLAALLAVVVAGCSDNPQKASTGGATKVRLGYSAWPGWFPWKVAEEQGLFAKNGLDVELTYFDSYTDSLNALATGNLDGNSQTLNDTLASVSGGADQRVVLTNDNSTGNDAIIAAPGIHSLADLKGKKVAAEQGTVDHFLLLLALQKAGLTQKDVTFTPLATDAAAAAFVAGRVDAVGVFAPFTTTALSRKGSAVIADSSDYPGAISDHLVVGGTFAEEHPDSVQRLVQTWFDALAYIAANKAAAGATMAKQGGVSVADYVSYEKGTTLFHRAQNLTSFAPGSTADHLDHQAKVIASFLVDAGLAEKAPSLDRLLDGSFVEKATGK